MATSGQPGDAGERSASRHQAWIRAFALRWDLEDQVEGAEEELEALLVTAEGCGWHEVTHAGLYASLSTASLVAGEGHRRRVDLLLEKSQLDGSAAMTALGLALRSGASFDSGDATTTASDADLARATALLEQGDGSALERITAHNRCAIAYGQRYLFELEERHYSAAQLLLDRCEDGRRVVALRFNQVEASLGWACALREINDIAGLAERVQVGKAAVRECERLDMPPNLTAALRAARLLLVALEGGDIAAADDIADLRRTLARETSSNRSYESQLDLALALSQASADTEAAAMAIERALESVDPRDVAGYYLCLRVAAELEAAKSGRSAAAMRYCNRQAQLRWGTRLSTLAAMEDMVEAERLRVEAEFFRRQANLDELTGLANRRGWARYAGGLGVDRIDSVSVILIDVDDFKAINDHHGHAAGDATLERVAGILMRAIRPDDLAARLGGDEFGLVLRSANLKVGAARAEAILSGIAEESWDDICPGLAVGVSIGVVAGRPVRFEELVAQCDAELYRAKAAGGSGISMSARPGH